MRTVTATEESLRSGYFVRQTICTVRKTYGSECWPSQRGKINKYTPNDWKKNT